MPCALTEETNVINGNMNSGCALRPPPRLPPPLPTTPKPGSAPPRRPKPEIPPKPRRLSQGNNAALNGSNKAILPRSSSSNIPGCTVGSSKAETSSIVDLSSASSEIPGCTVDSSKAETSSIVDLSSAASSIVELSSTTSESTTCLITTSTPKPVVAPRRRTSFPFVTRTDVSDSIQGASVPPPSTFPSLSSSETSTSTLSSSPGSEIPQPGFVRRSAIALDQVLAQRRASSISSDDEQLWTPLLTSVSDWTDIAKCEAAYSYIHPRKLPPRLPSAAPPKPAPGESEVENDTPVDVPAEKVPPPPPPPPPLPTPRRRKSAPTLRGSRLIKGLWMQCSACTAPLLSPQTIPSVAPAASAVSPAASTTRWYVKPTWRLWGEERSPGAIYTVYLKKVRYHRPTRSVSSDSDDEISHLEWETVRVRFVKAGTLERLVESLASDDGELESTYINVFLATYRTFSTAGQVLSLLLDRYELLAAGEVDQPDMVLEQHRNSPHVFRFNPNDDTKNILRKFRYLKCTNAYEMTSLYAFTLHLPAMPAMPPTAPLFVCTQPYRDSENCNKVNEYRTLVLALHVWLDSYPEDFRDPPDHTALHQLLLFTRQHLPDSELEVKVRHRLERFTREDETCHVYAGCSPQGPMQLVNGSSSGPKQSYVFPDIPEAHFAEQLTRMDAELFKKLVPHQCLGAIWSRRDKSRSQEAATVLATVNQFNAVSFRVISTVLVEPELKSTDRARIITTWIDIAQELRVLKNFSSLKAIISGLQSNPVYRLQRTWAALPREKVELYDELARIFSEDNNQWAQRELLMREGTAKFADTAGHNDRQLQKVFQKQLNNSGNISHGTIPYLGTFLTDLTMIDTAIPDMVGEGMINFDKKRKEFEVLAQIKLLQGAANAYNIPPDPLFDRWFDSILVLDDREAYQLSCQIEPASGGSVGPSGGSAARDPRQKKRTGLGHRKNDSIASTSSSSSSQFYCDLDSTTSSPRNSLDRKASPSQMSSSSSNSSLRSLDVSLGSSNHSNSTRNNAAPTPPGHLNAQLCSAGQNSSPPDFYIIRVTVETDSAETDGIIMYKSIMLGNSERTPQVIRNAMLKLNLEGNPEEYTLSQVLPDREMVLPPNANVYYAVNTQFNLNFILRPKKTRRAIESVVPNRTKSSRKLIAGS